MSAHAGRLDANAMFGVGAAFDFHAGLIPAGSALDAAARPGVVLPARQGAATSVAAIPAQQPRIRRQHPPPSTNSALSSQQKCSYLAG